MGSRDSILAQLKANKPEPIGLPIIDLTIFNENLDILKEFIKKVEVVGGNVLEAISNEDVILQIQKIFPDTKVKFSNLKNTTSFNTISPETIQKPHDLEDLDVLVLESNLGVAENGAVWLSDKEIPVRVLPFITKHVVIVISKQNIVSHMHEAYDKLKDIDYAYGLFLSGPSKTADIEQSLVIGAQGALSLTVFLK